MKILHGKPSFSGTFSLSGMVWFGIVPFVPHSFAVTHLK